MESAEWLSPAEEGRQILGFVKDIIHFLMLHLIAP